VFNFILMHVYRRRIFRVKKWGRIFTGRIPTCRPAESPKLNKPSRRSATGLLVLGRPSIRPRKPRPWQIHNPIIIIIWIRELEEVGTHKSAKTHAWTVFMPRDLDLWPFAPKQTGFRGSWWSSLVILAEAVF